MKYLLIALIALSLVEPTISLLLGEDSSAGQSLAFPDGVSDWGQLSPEQEAQLLAQIKSQMGPRDTLKVDRDAAGKIRNVTICRT